MKYQSFQVRPIFIIGLMSMFRINNFSTDFDKDLKDLKNILQKNQYPLKMIDHIVKSYLNDKINCRNEKVLKTQNQKLK